MISTSQMVKRDIENLGNRFRVLQAFSGPLTQVCVSPDLRCLTSRQGYQGV